MRDHAPSRPLWTRFMFVLLFAALLAAGQLLLDVAPAAAQQDVGSCFPSPVNCNSNDVELAQLIIRDVIDPCTSPGDTATVQFQAQFDPNASDRYDVGLFLNLLGGNSVQPPQATNSCLRAYLSPTTPPQPGPVNVSSGTGPFRNFDNDACGDIRENDGLTLYNLQTVTITCKDGDNNGVVDPVDYLLTWSQNPDTIVCNSTNDLRPGTTPKCRHLTAPINLQVGPRDLGIEKAADKAFAFPGDSLRYTLIVKNFNPANPATGVIVTDQLNSNLVNATVFSVSQGSCSIVNNLLTCNLGTVNPTPGGDVTIIIDTLVNPNLDPNFVAHISNTACVGGDQPEPNPDLLHPNCDTVTTTTPVTLSNFKATRNGDITYFEWGTATESANLGFHLYMEQGGERVRVNPSIVQSHVIDSLEPQSYSFEATGLQGDVFYVEDVDTSGQTREHGPFNLGEVYGEPDMVDPIDWAAITAEHQAKSEERAIANAAAVNAEVASVAVASIAAADATLNEQIGFVEGAGVAADTPRAYLPALQLGSNIAGEGTPFAAGKVNLSVNKTGLYRVTFEDLLAKNINYTGALAANLALTNRGQAVPIRVVSATTFGPGAYIEFYGQALDTLYTDTNIYTLEVNKALAKRIGLNKSNPGTAQTPATYIERMVVDDDRTYGEAASGDDPWFNVRLAAFADGPTTDTKSVTFNVEGYTIGAGPTQLELEVWGNTSYPQLDDHHLLVQLNGQQIADVLFDGYNTYKVQVNLPAGLLKPGQNTLTLVAPRDRGVYSDGIALDKYTVTYPRAVTARDNALSFNATGAVLRVNGFTSPDIVAYRADANGTLVRLESVVVEQTGSTYAAKFVGSSQAATYHVAAVGALRKPINLAPTPTVQDPVNGQANFVMISHPDFVAGLNDLVAARVAQGYSVKVVNVQDLYNKYTFGIFDPTAIKDYIADAAQQMGTEYVLLVGGDTYDYRNFLGKGGISFIPSLWGRTSAYAHYAAVDPLYADVDGNNVPDLSIGRFPVRTSAELQTAIAKTLTYAASDYGNKIVLAADKDYTGLSFAAQSDGAAQTLGNGWTITRAYITADRASVAPAKATLINAINSGADLVSYVGHSGMSAWTFDGLFASKDAAALTNAGKPTVVVQWGCWNTYYSHPSLNALGHKFMLSGDRGAAAVLGATAMTTSTAEEKLSSLIMPRIAAGMTLGQAVTESKKELGQTDPYLLDVLLGWTILGDPTIVVNR